MGNGGIMKNLVKIIRENPNCLAIIDNDSWFIYPLSSPNAYDLGLEEEELVSSYDELEPLKGNTYQEDNCYGGAILLALAEIAGINIESV